MADWDLYSIKINASKVSQKNDYINNFIDMVNDDFSSNLSCEDVYVNENTTITKVQIVEDNSNGSEKLNNAKSIIMKPSEKINVGDSIKWNNEYWLCTATEMFSDVYYKGTINKCLHTLRFYDKTSVLNAIISVPCVVSSTTVSSLGIDNQDKFDLLEGKIVIQVPNNKSTSTIYEKQRFILGQYVYNITGIDDITALGVLKISMNKVEKNDKDDFINGIAFNSEEIKNNYKISILSPDLSFAVSQTVQLNVQVTNNDGIVLNPNLTYTSSDTSVFTVDSNGLLTGLAIGTATISVSLTDESTIVATTPINITSTISDNYSVVISGSNSIIKKKQSVYSAKFYNNGTEITTEESIFYLTDINGGVLSTNVASIYSQDINGNCIVLAGNPSGIQYAYLHVKNASGNIVSEGYKIKIYSLI